MTEPIQPDAADSSPVPTDAAPPRRRARPRRAVPQDGLAADAQAPAFEPSGNGAGVDAPAREADAPSGAAGGDDSAPPSGGPETGGRRDAAKGPRGRFGRRRPGRGGRDDRDESPASEGGDAASGDAGGPREGRPPRQARAPGGSSPAARGPADPELAIPVYSSQARVGLNATDSRRRGAGAAARGPRDDDDAPKLHKLLADTGIGSRREMEELIMAGRVSVNGQPAHVGQRIGPNDQVRVNGRPLNRRVRRPEPKVLIYHKSPGEICSRDDPGQRATVFERLPRLRGERWVAVGRLDFNTEGLLIFTTSGEMANLLMHPRFGWEREYAVRILGRIDDELKARLLTGVPLEDGPANLLSLDDVGGDGANHWYRVTIAEGRNREVRRIFESVGLAVSRLVRIRFGPIGLPPGLARGRWVELPASDVATLGSLLKQAGKDAGPSPRRASAKPARPAPGVGQDLPESGEQGLRDAMNEGEMPAVPAGIAADDDELQMPRGPAVSGEPGRSDFLDDDEEDDEYESQPPPHYGQPVARGRGQGAAVNRDDDEWQPTSADAHLSGITRVVRKQGREQRFGFGQGGLPGQPRPPGQPRRGRGKGAQGGFGAGSGGVGGFGAGQGGFGGKGGNRSAQGGVGGGRGGQGGNRGGPGGKPTGPGAGNRGSQPGNRGGQGGNRSGGGGRSGGAGRRRGSA